MKTTYSLLLISLILCSTLWADPVSIDAFKKMNGMDREKAIQQAPPEQKEELKKIDLHIALLSDAGGEDGLKVQKESIAARDRGLGSLEGILHTQMQLWDQYIAVATNADIKAGMPEAEREAAARKLSDKYDALMARISTVHAIIFQIAPSPAALELEKRVEKQDKDLGDKFLGNWDARHPVKPLITKNQLDEASKQVDEFIEEMKALPKLTPEQAQKELDTFTDDKFVHDR